MKYLAILVGVLFLSSCSCLKKKEKPELLIINVLDQEFFNDCRITGSVNVPFEQLEDFAKKLDKDTQIVVYCSNYKCTASFLGARMFKQMGFKNVWAYEAGMAEWYQQKLPVEGLCAQSYLTMDNKPIEGDKDSDVEIISTEELRSKLQQGEQGTQVVACGY